MTSPFKMRRGGQKIRKSNDTFIVKKGTTTWGKVGPGVTISGRNDDVIYGRPLPLPTSQRSIALCCKVRKLGHILYPAELLRLS